MGASMLLVWDEDGNVTSYMNEMVAFDAEGRAVGYVDFEAHELAGGSMTDICVWGGVAREDLPVLPDPFYPPVTDNIETGRPVYVMPERQMYMNRGDVWVPEVNPRFVGAGTWPEFLDKPRDFKVDLRAGRKGGTHKVQALIHKNSGHRRGRAELEAEVVRRKGESLGKAAKSGKPPEPVEVSDLFGGPAYPVKTDEHGRTTGDVEEVRRPRTVLPVLGSSVPEPEPQMMQMAAPMEIVTDNVLPGGEVLTPVPVVMEVTPEELAATEAADLRLRNGEVLAPMESEEVT